MRKREWRFAVATLCCRDYVCVLFGEEGEGVGGDSLANKGGEYFVVADGDGEAIVFEDGFRFVETG